MLTPSVVGFEGDAVLVGKAAAALAARDPDKVADSFKRDMGSKAYHRKVNGWELPPEALAGFVLGSLKADAVRKLGPAVGEKPQVVITVPAYFDETRRRSTMIAGQLVDLEVLDILNEPTAAALAYGYQQGYLDRQMHWGGRGPVRILVYDLGGGTFDLTIVQIEGGSFQTIATDGDVYLGGIDWDEKLADIAAGRFLKQYGTDPRSDPILKHRLITLAETAKRTLSDRTRAAISLPLKGKACTVEVGRAEFEDATAPLLARTRNTAEIVLRQAKLRWSDVGKVLLVGGATRMPMVPRMLHELTGQDPDRSLSPELAVAQGAALYADLLFRRRHGGSGSFRIANVNSHSLGIVGLDGSSGKRRNKILIPKNTPLPHTVTRTFKTLKPNQRRVTVRVVEGESDDPDECFLIGTCRVTDLPPGLPAGWPVHVSYSYQENGRLQVAAKVDGHGQLVTTTFHRERSMADVDISQWSDYVQRRWQPRQY
jgi:molecular chaperone DnaK